MKRLAFILTCMLLLFILGCGGEDETEVVIDNSVESYAALLETGKAVTHRSNAELKKSAVKAGTGFSAGWSRGEQGEYEIVESSAGILEIEENILRSGREDITQMSVKQFPKKSLLRLTKANSAPVKAVQNADDLRLSEYVDKASDIIALTGLCPGNVEYSCYSIDYEQRCDSSGELKGDERVESVTLTFRRVFEGGAVRSSVSYAEFTFKAGGDIESIEIKWPEFQKIKTPRSQVAQSEPLKKAVSALKQVRSMRKLEEIRQVNRIRIAGLERAWYPVDADGCKILTPVHTIVTRIETDDGSERMKYIDMPLVKEYY